MEPIEGAAFGVVVAMEDSKERESLFSEKILRERYKLGQAQVQQYFRLCEVELGMKRYAPLEELLSEAAE